LAIKAVVLNMESLQCDGKNNWNLLPECAVPSQILNLRTEGINVTLRKDASINKSLESEKMVGNLL
jgi:hypothetical protein